MWRNNPEQCTYGWEWLCLPPGTLESLESKSWMRCKISLKKKLVQLHSTEAQKPTLTLMTENLQRQNLNNCGLYGQSKTVENVWGGVNTHSYSGRDQTIEFWPTWKLGVLVPLQVNPSVVPYSVNANRLSSKPERKWFPIFVLAIGWVKFSSPLCFYFPSWSPCQRHTRRLSPSCCNSVILSWKFGLLQ